MAIIDQNIGMVTAYAYAVSKGYKGTEEQFAQDMADVGINISEIREAITEFNEQTVPAAIQAVVDEGLAQIQAIQSAGTEQVSAVNSAGSAKVSKIDEKGTLVLDGIEFEGTRQVEAVNSAGTTQTAAVNSAGSEQTAAVNSAGSTQVSAVNSAGSTQVGAVNSAGSTQVESVNSAGTTQISAIQAKGEEVLESIPQDYSKMSYLQELLHDEVADTVQTYTFVDGSVSKIEHKRNNVSVRTDQFVYESNTITETRTLDSGQSVEIETNLETLETSVSYTE